MQAVDDDSDEGKPVTRGVAARGCTRPQRLRLAGGCAVLVALLALTACATLPETLQAPVADDAPGVSEARADPDAVRGQLVRWGGTIAGIENLADHTRIEVVGRSLEQGGRPRTDVESDGRFLAIFPGFLDPAVYERGRLVTVVGTVDGVERRKVGEYDYDYARVRVDSHQLWRVPLEPAYMPHPYYRPPWYYADPFYDPWYWRDPFWPHHPRFRGW